MILYNLENNISKPIPNKTYIQVFMWASSGDHLFKWASSGDHLFKWASSWDHLFKSASSGDHLFKWGKMSANNKKLPEELIYLLDLKPGGKCYEIILSL